MYGIYGVYLVYFFNFILYKFKFQFSPNCPSIDHGTLITPPKRGRKSMKSRLESSGKLNGHLFKTKNRKNVSPSTKV